MNGDRQDSDMAAARDGGIKETDDEHTLSLQWLRALQPSLEHGVNVMLK
jgi:hypothetical protein